MSEAKTRQVIRLLAQDLSASTIAELTAVSRLTINRILFKLLQLHMIVTVCEAQSPLSGEVEVDESYFGAKRVRCKRGRRAREKTIVFGVLKRQGKVYTEIVPDVSKKRLQAVIRGKVSIIDVIHLMAGVAIMA